MKLFKTPMLDILCFRLLNSVGYTILNVGNINHDGIYKRTMGQPCTRYVPAPARSTAPALVAG